MDDDEVVVAQVEINGVKMFTVRVTHNGVLTIKAHCNSRYEARDLAEEEAQRLGVEVRYLD